MADLQALRQPAAPTEVDWGPWVRSIERKRRGLARPARWPAWVAREATRASFCLEGISVTDAQLDEALAPGRPLRSRAGRRLRHHLAILRGVDRQARPLRADTVIRWYTSVSDGLAAVAIAPDARQRLLQALRQINSPQMRLQPAILEIACLHADLLGDAIFPGFNGILARLLLHVHLSQCGLPPVVLEFPRDDWRDPRAVTIASRLLELIDGSLTRLMQKPD